MPLKTDFEDQEIQVTGDGLNTRWSCKWVLYICSGVLGSIEFRSRAVYRKNSDNFALPMISSNSSSPGGKS